MRHKTGGATEGKPNTQENSEADVWGPSSSLCLLEPCIWLCVILTHAAFSFLGPGSFFPYSQLTYDLSPFLGLLFLGSPVSQKPRVSLISRMLESPSPCHLMDCTSSHGVNEPSLEICLRP